LDGRPEGILALGHVERLMALALRRGQNLSKVGTRSFKNQTQDETSNKTEHQGTGL
jgi:hypothetical protein